MPDLVMSADSWISVALIAVVLLGLVFLAARSMYP
jgi:hypothetical protein